MDAEKVTEVEMKELNPEVQDDQDAEKGKMEKTTAEKGAEDKEVKTEKDIKEEGAEKKAEEKEIKEEEGNVYSKLNSPTEDVYNPVMPSSSSKRIKAGEKAKEKEIKEEEEDNVYNKLNSPTEDIYNKAEKVEKNKKEENEEAEEDLYCKLKDPSENVYMATMSSSAKHKDVYKKVLLYKRISAVFIILSMLLLAVVLAVALKLNGKCPESTDSKCICEPCPTTCPTGCNQCEVGWGMFENSCYFKSKERLNWQESREECQKKGGDLVVIDNERVQKFLSTHSTMVYWIGLQYSEEQQWLWINNAAPIQSYWDHTGPNPNSQGSCALLNGGMSQLNNWFSDHCEVISHYFCQKRK